MIVIINYNINNRIEFQCSTVTYPPLIRSRLDVGILLGLKIRIERETTTRSEKLHAVRSCHLHLQSRLLEMESRSSESRPSVTPRDESSACSCNLLSSPF